MKDKIEKILREVWEDNMSFESEGSEETIKNAINQLSTLIQEERKDAVEGFVDFMERRKRSDFFINELIKEYLESEGVKSNEKDDTPEMLDRTTDSFEYYYWCYDFGDGGVAYKNSVEFIVIADNEHAALKKAGEIVKRDIYKLISVDKR